MAKGNGKRAMTGDEKAAYRSRQIRASLVILGVTQADVAQQARVSPATVSNVIAGRRRNAVVEETLCWVGVPAWLVDPSHKGWDRVRAA